MGFAIPSLPDLVARAVASFSANLPGADASLPGNNVSPAAKVIAESVWNVFGKLAWVYRQIFVASADRETLVRRGADYGLSPRAAAAASGIVTVAHSAAITIAVGATFRRADGVVYQSLDSYAAPGAAGSVNLAVQALTPAANGDAPAATALAILSGISGAGAGSATATVGAGGIFGGLDAEATEDFRARLLFRLRFAPQAGTSADYVRWVMALPGVTRVHVEPLWSGPGTVRVFPILDDVRPDGIPNVADLALVSSALASVQPAAAGVTVAAAAALPIDVTISGLGSADALTRGNVVEALKQTIRARGRVAGSAEPIAGLPFLATPYSFSRSWIAEAVSSAAGEEKHVLVAPAADVAVAAGQIPALGAVTFL